jgi:hypothetical protein
MIFNKEETKNLLNMLRSADKDNATIAFESLKKVNVEDYIGELITLYKFGNTEYDLWRSECRQCTKAIENALSDTTDGHQLSTGACLSAMTTNKASNQSIELFMELFTENMIGFLSQMGYPADKFEINIKLKDGQSTESK